MIFTVAVVHEFFEILIGLTLQLFFLQSNIGNLLTLDGVCTVLYAFSTLKTRKFSWSDYQNFKISRIGVLLSNLCETINASKNKWTLKIADIRNLTVKSTGTFFKRIISKTKNSRNAIRKKAFKTLIKCKNNMLRNDIELSVNNIMNIFLNQVTDELANTFDNTIKNDLESHALPSTIDKLSEHYKVEHLKKIISEKITEIQNCPELNESTSSKLLNLIDLIVHSDKNTSEIIKSFVSDTVIKTATNYIINVYNQLNLFLETLFKSSENESIAISSSSIDIKKFRNEALEHTRQNAMLQYQNLLYSNVINPLHECSEKKIEKISVENVVNLIKDSILKHKDEKLTRRAIGILEIMKNQKVLSDENELKDILIEIPDILTNTKNINLYKISIKRDIPIDNIGIECVRSVLEKTFKEKFNIIIKRRGHSHEYASENDSDMITIKLELVDNNLKSVNRNFSGDDCLYFAIADQYLNLVNQMTPKEFRNAVTNEINTNENIKMAIATYNKVFCFETDVFGDVDAIIQVHRRHRNPEKGQNIGLYHQLLKANPNRRMFGMQIYYIPSADFFNDNSFEKISKYSQSSFLLNEEVYINLQSINGPNYSEQFVKEQNDFLRKKKRAEALLMVYKDRHNVELSLWSNKNEKKDGIDFETYMNSVHKQMKDHTNFERNQRLISEDERRLIVAQIDEMTLNITEKVDVRKVNHVYY